MIADRQSEVGRCGRGALASVLVAIAASAQAHGQESAAAPSPAAVEPAAPAPAVGAAVLTIAETAVLIAPSPTMSVTFGMVNGISGDRIVVTGPEVVRGPGIAGQVATFTLSDMGTWQPIPEMLAFTGCREGDLIMGRVAFAGTVLCLSHERRDGSSSIVDVFEPSTSERSGWIAAGPALGPPEGSVEPAFGSAIATDGRFIAVSCVDQRVLGDQSRIANPSPKVYMFKAGPAGWAGLGFLQRDSAKDPKFFGASLAMTPGRVVVGCPKAIQPAPKQPLVQGGDPVVCVWSESEGSWALEAEIAPPQGVANIGFGQVVAASDSLIAVRAGLVTTPGADVFVYRKSESGWTFDGSLAFSADTVKGPAFGSAIAAGDDFIVLGDSSAEHAGRRGLVSVFIRSDSGWAECARLRPTVKTSSARWGVSVKVDGRRVLVGHPANEREGITPGGSILFTLPPAGDLKVPVAAPSSAAAVDVPLGTKK